MLLTAVQWQQESADLSHLFGGSFRRPASHGYFIMLRADLLSRSFRLQAVKSRHALSFTVHSAAEHGSMEEVGHAGPLTDRPSGAMLPVQRYPGTSRSIWHIVTVF